MRTILVLGLLLALVPLATSAQTEPDCATQTCIYVPSVAVAPPPSVIRNPDFELGNNGDWMVSSSDGQQPITTQHPIMNPHSGQWVVRMGGHLSETTIISQEILLPTVPPGYELELNYWWFTDGPPLECYADPPDDGFIRVQVSPTKGRGVAHPLCDLSPQRDMYEDSVSITEFAGKPATIIIQVRTVGNYAGELYIDDLSFRTYCNDPICQ